MFFRMNIWIKRFLVAVSVFIILGIILNPQYFYANLRFRLGRKPNVNQQIIVAVQAGEKISPDTLVIPSLGLAAPIVYSSVNNQAADEKALAKGVAHYFGTAIPGEAGNVFIFGHSSDYLWNSGNYKTVFALLPQIKVGAEIFVSNPSGQVFKYMVIQTAVASPADVVWLSQENYEKKLLTLQTSYPIGTALRRFIVRAVLKD